MSLPPGPKLPTLVMSWHWLRRPFEFLDDCATRYGDAFTIRFTGLPPLVVFRGPEDVKEIFSNDGTTLQAGKFNLSLRAFLGEHSVLMLDGNEHARQRRLLLPPFHGERMQAYGDAMLDVTNDSIDAWPSAAPFALHRPMQAITLEVILRTIFGVEDARRLATFSKVLTELLDIGAWAPLLLPFMQVDLGPYSPWGRYMRKRVESDRILYEEIRQRREQGSRGRKDILSLLIDARDEEGQPMTDEELHDELVTLLVAGHETTATALTWAFRWILTTPDVRQRLRKELAGAERQGPLTPERISKLDLVDAVAREALRLSPVIPIVGRILDAPGRVAGYDLPAGVGVLCSIYLAQRRPSVYPEPTKFDPDRFLGKKFSPNEFFPFGGGIRRCIGMAFALYEMKIVLAQVLSRTTLALATQAPIRVARRGITLTPSGGLPVRLESRLARTESAVAA